MAILSSAAEQSLGIHEGPQQLALRADGDPFTAALVPAPGTPPPAGEVTYSKGAALVASLEAYLERFAPGSFQVCDFPVKASGAASYLQTYAIQLKQRTVAASAYL